MSEEDFLKKYNLKKVENTKDYQIDNETIIKELQERIDKAIKELEEAYTNPRLWKNVSYISEPFQIDLLNILKGNKNEKLDYCIPISKDLLDILKGKE